MRLTKMSNLVKIRTLFKQNQQDILGKICHDQDQTIIQVLKTEINIPYNYASVDKKSLFQKCYKEMLGN